MAPDHENDSSKLSSRNANAKTLRPFQGEEISYLSQAPEEGSDLCDAPGFLQSWAWRDEATAFPSLFSSTDQG
jgi:hypothetical protein